MTGMKGKPIYPQEEGMGPLERGRHRYALKDFSGAMEAFTEAVRISSGHMLMTALDHRAATYEKLDQLRNAIRDSRQMIELMPNKAKGYLRCGKVLQLMKNQDLALKMYERGLQKVKIGADDERIKLQEVFSRLQSKQAPQKLLDPLTKLPVELLGMILQELDMSDLVKCLCLSNSWKRVLESSNKLWTYLDTTTAKRLISQKSLQAYFRRSAYTVDRARISVRPENKGGFDQKKLMFLTKTCKQLRELTVEGHGILGDSLVKAAPYAKNLQSIKLIKNCKIPLGSAIAFLESNRAALNEVVFTAVQIGQHSLPIVWPSPSFELIKTLHLQAYVESSQKPIIRLDEIVASFPNVESVALVGWEASNQGLVDLTPWQYLRILDLRDMGLTFLPLFPAEIESITISKNKRMVRPQLDPEAESHQKFSMLTTFDCEETEMTHAAVASVITPAIDARNLKILRMGTIAVERAPGSDITEHYPPSETLEELGLGNLDLDEASALKIIRQYPNVTKIDLSWSKITGVAVRQLVERGVKILNVCGCSKISPDAIQFARSKCVVVDWHLPTMARSRSFRDAFT
ncbi:hypothetical protein BP6252_03110 [Coleophoma cylindrospora]|uniref:F-box domain-containing protein n=1 Tax=Coleophoma cylindrospora TaxID=1849047 RepID=A0A3D8S6T9_9HELO|nr:hypothetical protein BP6252_03110 [Coleophoma cylindrospora]